MSVNPPPLLCMHGVGGSAEEWAPAAQALGDRVNAVTEMPAGGSFAVAGHSFGGVQALRLAAERRDRVAALVLTGCFFPPARGGRSYAAAVWDYARHRALYVREVAGRRRRPRPTARATGQMATMARFGIRPQTFHTLADAIRCPVLVVHGDQDHVVPVSFARAAVATQPAWAYAEIHGGGHFAHRDRADEWAAIVAPWLVIESS
jgi:pimeloyl-ACP methyl ester carboxylesterase